MATKTRKLESSNGNVDSGALAPDRDNPLFDASMTRMMGWPVEMWLRTQAGVLKAVEPVATGWFERRREAVTAALDTIERLAACSDLNEAAAIQREWFEGSMRRLDTDLHAFADHAVALSHEAMSATRYATQTSTEAVGLAMQSAQNATRQAEHAVEQAA